MIGSIRNFKISFCPQKSRLKVQLKTKLPNMTDWHKLTLRRVQDQANFSSFFFYQKNIGEDKESVISS